MMVGTRELGPFSCPWQLSLGGEGCCWYSTPALLRSGDCSLATKSRMSEGRRELKGAPNQASKRRWRSSRAPGTQHVHTASRAHTPGRPHYRCSLPLTCHDYICDTCVGHLSLTCLYVLTWQGPGLVAS